MHSRGRLVTSPGPGARHPRGRRASSVRGQAGDRDRVRVTETGPNGERNGGTGKGRLVRSIPPKLHDGGECVAAEALARPARPVAEEATSDVTGTRDDHRQIGNRSLVGDDGFGSGGARRE